MTHRDARSDWQAFAADAIPTKANVRPLETVLADIMATFGEAGPPSILDAGCGVGVVSGFIYSKGFSVVGVDINQSAVVQALRSTAALSQASDASSGRRLDFFCEDILNPDCPAIQAGAFDGVVCQLVISIVGPSHDRAALLANLYKALRPGGYLYLSASGVSDAINPLYAELYRSDLEITKEQHTYVSRDDHGRGLYATHHFTEEELNRLLQYAGFTDKRIHKQRETSSRRTSESAYFFYCCCRKPASTAATSR
jgi:SAM-dependent methyltransferase